MTKSEEQEVRDWIHRKELQVLQLAQPSEKEKHLVRTLVREINLLKKLLDGERHRDEAGNPVGDNRTPSKPFANPPLSATGPKT